MTLNSSDSHNAFYVERDIRSWYQDGSLWDRIAGTNGYDEMEGIFPGCYFDMSRGINTTGSQYTGSNKIIIAALNHFKSEYGIVKNHITLVPDLHFGKSRLNDADTFTGGFVNSEMFKSTLGSPATTGNITGTINEQLYAEFGNHLITYSELLTSSFSQSNANNRHHGYNGVTSSWTEKQIQSCLLSEEQVAGTIMWSTSGWEGGRVRGQFPLFRYKPNMIKRWIWLRGYQREGAWITTDGKGQINGSKPTNSDVFLYPYFNLG